MRAVRQIEILQFYWSLDNYTSELPSHPYVRRKENPKDNCKNESDETSEESRELVMGEQRTCYYKSK